MAKTKKQEIEVFEFDDIHRGTSMTIPIRIKKSDGTAFDLTGYTAIFTLKPYQSDFDYDDDRALISKEFTPYTNDPNKQGRIDITLTSKDLWVTPGLYYFDIVLMKGPSSQRILLATTNIVGGPTNKNVRHGGENDNQEDFFLHDPIDITPTDKKVIAVSVPFVSDVPENILEGVTSDPQYIYKPLGDPARHGLIRYYGPRLSLMMTFDVAHDHTNHKVRFDEFFLNRNIPAPCPLKNGRLTFNNRRVEIELFNNMEMDMTFRWMGIQYNSGVGYDVEHPECDFNKLPRTFDGDFGIQSSLQPIYIGDRIKSGQLTIQLRSGNNQIHMTADFFIPDDDGGRAYWMVRVDWFNWVDDYEPDPEREDISTHFPEVSMADTWEGYWPPDMWYCYHDGKKE